MAARGVQEYYCLYCTDHIFANKRNLNVHFLRKHGNLPKVSFISGSETRKCVHCNGDYTLMTQKKFLDHCRSCIENPERAKNQVKLLLSCPICDLKVTRKDNLKLHMKRFHSELPQTINSAVAGGSSLNFDFEISEFKRGTLDPSKLIQAKEMIKHDTKIPGTSSTRSVFRFSDLALEISRSGLFYEVIETIFYYLFELHGASDDDQIQTILNSAYLMYPVRTAKAKTKEFQIANLLKRLDAVVQSFNDLPVQTDLTLSITSINPRVLLEDPLSVPTTVSGRKNLNPKHFRDVFNYLETKKGYLDISKFQTENTNKSCLPLSIGIALHFKPPYSAISRTRWFKQARDFPIQVVTYAKDIYRVLGQEFNIDVELSYENMNKIQLWLTEFFNVVLQVYQMKSYDVVKFFHGNTLSNVTIQILVANEHAGLITSEKNFFSKKVFCETCLNFVKKNGYHKCPAIKCCHLCRSAKCKGEKHARLKLCLDFNRRFKDDKCYQLHKISKRNGTVCKAFRKCNKCFKKIARKNLRKHSCGIRYCKVCLTSAAINTPDLINHLCYMAPILRQKANAYNEPIHLIYDIECKRIENKLVPIMLIVFRTCPNCFEITDPTINTACCGKRCNVFKGDNCMAESVNYIFFSKFKLKAIAIAHFGSGFDSLYIMETLLKGGHKPKIIPKGNKILRLELNNVTCIDSLMFFHARLAKLPKLFGFRQQKLFFPHDFHPSSPYNYVGPWPEPNLFPASYSAEDKLEFNVWYTEQRKKFALFDYMKQLETYCLQVIVLIFILF